MSMQGTWEGERALLLPKTVAVAAAGVGNFCVQSLKLADMSKEVSLDGASGSFPPCVFSDSREPGHLGVRPSSRSFFAHLFGSRGRMKVGQTALLHPDQSSKDR